jgi:hypothetical protein
MRDAHSSFTINADVAAWFRSPVEQISACIKLRQCSYIARTLYAPPTMPRKVEPSETLQFSITLPAQAVALIQQLASVGLHGSSRGEIVRKLILDQLTYLAGQGIVKVRKKK